MFGLGVPELIVILVVALLFFGPKKLPELGTFLGRSLREFRDSLDGPRDDETSPPPAPQRKDEQGDSRASKPDAGRPDNAPRG